MDAGIIAGTFMNTVAEPFNLYLINTRQGTIETTRTISYLMFKNVYVSNCSIFWIH